MKIKNQLKLFVLGLTMALMPSSHAMMWWGLSYEEQAQKKLNKQFIKSVKKAGSQSTSEEECRKELKNTQICLEKGADIDFKGCKTIGYTSKEFTALMWVSMECLEVVQYLVQQGANINTISKHCIWKEGITALMHATVCHQPEIVKYLLEHGAEVHQRDIITDQVSRSLLQDAKTFYEMSDDKAWVIGTDSGKYSPEVKELGFNIMFNKLEFCNLMDIHHYDPILQKLSKEAFKRGICLLHLKNQPQLIKCIENNWHVGALDDIKEIVKNDPNSGFSKKIAAALGKTDTQNSLLKKLENNNFGDIIINQ